MVIMKHGRIFAVMPLAINATSPVVALRCSLLRQLLIEKLVTLHRL